jgi:hypothetical protein
VDKLIQKIPESGSTSTHSSSLTSKDPPPPLDPRNYRHVRFWTAKSFDEYIGNLVGETDGLATRQKRRGRRMKSDEEEDTHPYLETVDGMSVPRHILAKVGQKARRLWQALNTAGLAPASWGKASEIAYTYFHGEMLNEPEFEFFRYCEGNWKIKRWTTKAYASWKHNHIKQDDIEEAKTLIPKKRKLKLLDNPTLLQIGSDNEDSILGNNSAGPMTAFKSASPEINEPMLSAPRSLTPQATQVRI